MALVLPSTCPHSRTHRCPAKIIMPAQELNLTNSTTNRVLTVKSAPTLISRSMSPLVASMVLSFCKTTGERSSSSAHHPLDPRGPFADYLVRRHATAGERSSSSAVRTTERPTARSAPLSHPPSPRPPLPWLQCVRWMMEIYGAVSESVPLSLTSCNLPRSASSPSCFVLPASGAGGPRLLPPSIGVTAVSAPGTALPPRRCCSTCTTSTGSASASSTRNRRFSWRSILFPFLFVSVLR
jgi:hypothetical protein